MISLRASVPDLNGNVRSEFVSTSVICDVHKLLKSCFNQAVKWDIMEKNPAFKATVPKHKSKKASKILCWSGNLAEEAKAAGYSCAWHRSNIRKNRSKRCVDFLKKIIDVRKTTWYVFFEKKEIILKANLLKGRVAKPGGTKVRKLDHVSRLPLFPYHHNIWKRCLNRRDSDTFYTI